MTTPPGSRQPLPPPIAGAGVTLATVLAAIATAPGLTASRRRDMASAVRSVARLLGLDLGMVPAEPRLLARRLDEIAPAAHGLSPQRWANLRSLLRAGLTLLGPVAPGRHLAPLTPEWQALWDRLPTRGLKIALSRVMRFAGSSGIDPAVVTASVFTDFAAHLERSLIKDPAGALCSARSAWNRARSSVPGWPDVAWDKGPRRADHFSLPWSSFPESLQREVEAWAAHLRGDNLLESDHRPLRPISVKNRVQRMRGFASALVHRGCDPATLAGLAVLVEPETVKAGLRFYLDRNGNRPAPGVADVAEMLLAIARHWVKVPQAQEAELKAIAARLQPSRRSGLTEKNRTRLRQLEDPAQLRALLHLPQRLLAKADARPRGQRAAVLAQTALAIELLLVAPMRVSNLAGIDCELHITRPGRSRGVALLSFVDTEVKNATALDYPLPPSTIALLDRYLADYRPLLAPAGSTALFPARDGGSKGRSVLGPRISRTLRKYTGLQINPHLFRHVAAKLQLEAEPGSYELMRRVLGHQSIDTTIRAYTGMESAAAVRHYDATLERLRLATPPAQHRNRRSVT